MHIFAFLLSHQAINLVNKYILQYWKHAISHNTYGTENHYIIQSQRTVAKLIVLSSNSSFRRQIAQIYNNSYRPIIIESNSAITRSDRQS